MVPVVPIALTKCVTRPAVSAQISGPVVSKCARGLSALANWSSTRPLPSRCICSARSRAYSMPPERGVRIEFGAKGPHRLRTLDRQVLRHDQHHAVAADRRRHGQRDAGVAGGGLDQRVAGADLASLLGAADHGDGRAVLHRSRGVVAFELAQDDVAARRTCIARQTLQPHQRRAADGVFQGLVGGCRSIRHRRRSSVAAHCRSAALALQAMPRAQGPCDNPPLFGALQRTPARVTKSVDVADSKSAAARRASSSLAAGTSRG